MSVVTKSSMRVLGVVFDSQMKWDIHVEQVLQKAKKSIQGLRILRRNLHGESFHQVLNAKFYSKLYYSSVVWLSSVSKSYLKRIESLHYLALRIYYNHYQQTISREILEHDLRRATPLEWTNYSTARIYNTGLPFLIFKGMESQSNVVKRPQRQRFYDISVS